MADEWRLAVDWLVRCQILPADHKATRADATAFDLAQALRDGVLLCHLLNTLQPGCIDMKDFSSRPQMSQFLCMKNIRTFLQTCTTVFGIDQRNLFKPNELFDVKDFKKVLDTLSRLSKSELSQRKYRGFHNSTVQRRDPYYNDLEVLATGFPPDSSDHDAEQDDDIYGNLQDLAIENDLEDQEDIYDTVYQEEEEKIYDDLLRHKSVAVHSTEPQTKRDHCIRELLETERNYKVALQMIIEHFIKPLHTILPESDRRVIFAHIQELYNVHKELYDKLHHSVTHGQPRLAEVFIQAKSKMLIYGDFCSNLPKAQERIDKICENETQRNKILEMERRANEGKFRLRDLLHVPMQRVLKYHLLMRELIKNTDKSSPEREELEKALEAMQDLSLYVNEVKRDHEGLQVIEEIQNSINDLRMPANTSLRDYGRFQKDGELKVLSHLDNRQRNRLDAKNSEKRHIFLFDKVMLMCKAKGDTYSFKDAIVLGEFRIDDSPQNAERRPEKWNFPFIMVKQDKSIAYTFFAKTAEQREKWKEAVALALDNSNPAQGRNFVMYTFDKPRECDVCGKLLRGVFYQGYQCVDSKKAVHKECIGKPFKTPNSLPPRAPKPAPVIFQAVAEKRYSGQPTPPSHCKPALYFSKDDVIDVVEKTEENWWKGRLRGEEGYIPSGFVKEKKKKVSYEEANPKNLLNGSVLKSDEVSSNGALNATPPTPKKREIKSFPSHLWYCGEMERRDAQRVLDPLPDGTFLIRVTNNPTRQGELSLSIKYANAVRHIKVNRTPDGRFYLAELRYFNSVQDLVDYYQITELVDSFPEVCTTLKHPYKKVATGPRVLGYAVAIYDYAATSTSQVTLQVNDKITILSKTGQDKGWWKGENLRTNRIGYFPLAYVKEDDEA